MMIFSVLVTVGGECPLGTEMFFIFSVPAAVYIYIYTYVYIDNIYIYICIFGYNYMEL